MNKQTSKITPFTFFSHRWWWATLSVFAGIMVLIRLGTWQLDRLDQRRAQNAYVLAQLNAPPIDLNAGDMPAMATLALTQATATGTYDFEGQIFVVQQRYENRLGWYVMTPLLLTGREDAVLVNRGWVPSIDHTYPVSKTVTVVGYLQESENLPNGQVPAIPKLPQQEWFRVEIAGIQAQTPYPLLPFYLIEANEAVSPPPYPITLEFDLSEGPHLSYAIQWFIFATILGGGYIYFVWQQTKT